MKKKFNFGRLGALALALTLITTCLTGGTLAKYTSSVEGKGTATVAKWAVNFKSGEVTLNKNFNISLTDTTIDVKADTIAPGSKGALPITIDATGSETAVTLSYKIDKTELNSLPIKFYSDESYTTEMTTLSANQDYAASVANKKWTTTVYWKWIATDSTDETAINDADTAAGISTSNTTGTISITLTAEQDVTPKTAP